MKAIEALNRLSKNLPLDNPAWTDADREYIHTIITALEEMDKREKAPGKTMKTADSKYTTLTAALERAKKAAQLFANSEDGGTCNFDSPAIDYRAMHMSKAKAEEAIRGAGLRSFEWKSWGGMRLVVCGMGEGQGNRQTRMAEAAQKSMEADGIVTSMYYQMD